MVLTMRTMLPEVPTLAVAIAVVLPRWIPLLVMVTVIVEFRMAPVLESPMMLVVTMSLVMMRQARMVASRVPPLGPSRPLMALVGSPVKVLPAGVNMANGLPFLSALIRLVVPSVVIRAEKLGPLVVTLVTARAAVLVPVVRVPLRPSVTVVLGTVRVRVVMSVLVSANPEDTADLRGRAMCRVLVYLYGGCICAVRWRRPDEVWADTC